MAKAPLNKWQLAFCRVVFQLDRIPRYGRLYTLYPKEMRTKESWHGPAEWTWQRHGRWGLNLLKDMGLLWAYIDTVSPYEGWSNGTDR